MHTNAMWATFGSEAECFIDCPQRHNVGKLDYSLDSDATRKGCILSPM